MNGRTGMLGYSTLLCLVSGVGAPVAQTQLTAQARPHILLILIDNLGRLGEQLGLHAEAETEHSDAFHATPGDVATAPSTAPKLPPAGFSRAGSFGSIRAWYDHAVAAEMG